ncbi:MAG: amino acid permease, partial [Abditibacteriota bacterium]|nr:amino acid permease [Abditibacteriota bacterium]
VIYVMKPRKKQREQASPFDMRAFFAYPSYSSVTVSSVIYASEVYLLVLAAGGGASLAAPVGLYIALGFIGALLLCLLITNLYPNGGNCYTIVSGSFSHPAWPAFASVSMLCGYIAILAVCVCCSAELLGCMFVRVQQNMPLWSVLILLVLMFANLRGSGSLRSALAAGGYLFVLCALALILIGVVVNYAETVEAETPAFVLADSGGAALAFKAFIFGFASLSGIMTVTERHDLSRRSASPMSVLYVSGIVSVCLFLGFSLLCAARGIMPADGTMTLWELCLDLTGGVSFFAYLTLGSGVLFLLSAANSCFAYFPRLIAVMAEGQLAPRQMRNPGEIHTYSNGVGLLTVFAAAAVLLLRGEIALIIPFLAVFQFAAFCLMLLSAAVRYYYDRRVLLCALSLAGVVAVAALILVFALIGVGHGTLAAIGIEVLLTVVSCRIKKHYTTLAAELSLEDTEPLDPRPYKTTALILTSGIHRGVLPAISYAKSISQDTRALFIATDEQETRQIKEHWERYAMGIPLVILDSPARNIVQPVLRYVREARRERPGYMINVIIPEIVFRSYFSKLLHNKVALVLRLILSFQKDVIVTHVSYYPAMENKGETYE